MNNHDLCAYGLAYTANIILNLSHPVEALACDFICQATFSLLSPYLGRWPARPFCRRLILLQQSCCISLAIETSFAALATL